MSRLCDRVSRKFAASNPLLLLPVLSPIEDAAFSRKGLARPATDPSFEINAEPCSSAHPVRSEDRSKCGEAGTHIRKRRYVLRQTAFSLGTIRLLHRLFNLLWDGINFHG